ncbi:hypothetical protein KI387_041350, partial [Taxus chinensis]
MAAIPTATRIILDTKQLIKDYKGELTRSCAYNEWAIDDGRDAESDVHRGGGHGAADSQSHVDHDHASPASPEMVVLPPHATIGDLKEAAQRALRQTFVIMEGLTVEDIPELNGEDDDLLFGAIESGSAVTIHGTGIDLSSDLRYEGGNAHWTVDCPCGANDDDGERMIACDMCE